jgi:hypothetical protein
VWLRFVVTKRGEGCAHRPGVTWFEEHLPLPDRSKLDRRAIFWFKTGSDRLIERIWDLVELLKEYGYHVELIKTARPGRVCYEDDYQVAATPFRGHSF